MKKATRLYQNGIIVTMDPENRICEALALYKNQILKAGTKNEVMAHIDEDTEIIDLQGKTILPGFYDSHGHMSMAGQANAFSTNLACPPMGTMRTIEDCKEALREFAKRVPEGNISGYAYDDTLIAEKRPLYKEDLDEVSTERPIWVSQSSGHIGYCNSKMLEIMNYTKDTPNPEGGVIQRDPITGEPNGILEETAKNQVQTMGIKQIMGDPDSTMKAIAYISDVYAKAGVTTASEGGGSRIPRTVLENLLKAVDKDILKIRVVVNPPVEQADDWYKIKVETDMVTVGGSKIMHDGSLQAFTGYLTKPYYTPFQGDATYCGYPTRSREALVDLVKSIYAKGRQALCHCNGDAAIDDYLYAIEEAQKEYPRTDDRPVVIHAQTSRRDQLRKMKQIHAIPSFYLLHTYYWGERHVNTFLGPERGNNISPAKWAQEEGVRFTTHCDTPVVPQTPLLSIWAAVNRMSFGGVSIGPEQKVDALEAVKSYTIHAAYQNYEEHIKGSLEPGKYADLVILDENPLTCPPEAIKDIHVLETIVGGKTVYQQ